MLVIASLVLGFTTFDALSGFGVVWLHLTPMRPCSDVTIWEASLDAELFCAYSSLFHSTWCYACHACLRHPLAFYASLHACLHVHAWVLLATVSSMLQHNGVLDIRSKPTFVPRGYYLLFHFCLLVLLLVYLFSCSLACHVYHAYLLYASFICSLHIFPPLFVCWFLVFAFACTHMEWGHLELGHSLLGASKKGMDISM